MIIIMIIRSLFKTQKHYKFTFYLLYLLTYWFVAFYDIQPRDGSGLNYSLILEAQTWTLSHKKDKCTHNKNINACQWDIIQEDTANILIHYSMEHTQMNKMIHGELSTVTSVGFWPRGNTTKDTYVFGITSLHTEYTNGGRGIFQRNVSSQKIQWKKTTKKAHHYACT